MIKNTLFTVLLLLLVTTSCKEEYADLEDGVYAQFVTNKDTMVAKLFYKEAPVTVANFVALAEGEHPLVKEEYKNKRYYDSTTFHRVINDFMIQGGDPTATGSGDPGYKFEDEFSPNLKHDKPGILSMANSGPNTNGSQFFITEKPTPFLDAFKEDGSMKECGTYPGGGCHAVFGEIVLGLNTQDSISNVAVNPQNNKPIEPVVIKELNIIRKGSEAKKFDAPKVFTDELPKLKERQQKMQEEARLAAEKEREEREAKNVAAAKELEPLLAEYEDKSKTLASGLKIYYIEKGDGEKPKTGSTVKVNYEGYFTDARMFDSNVKERAEAHGMYNASREKQGGYNPMPMPISPDARMIQGFKEGAAQLRVGDKVFLYMPSHIAYGERGNPPVIPGNTDIMFILEMVQIVE
ncbi:MAG: peptidylprolyl isomerase [Winogradskyella sp.]|nr:peptidylprolyl isomerase [Bacteroidia bacterium]NNC46352.1 peptidylprolyl isomerase [Winogradskyella sp.]